MIRIVRSSRHGSCCFSNVYVYRASSHCSKPLGIWAYWCGVSMLQGGLVRSIIKNEPLHKALGLYHTCVDSLRTEAWLLRCRAESSFGSRDRCANGSSVCGKGGLGRCKQYFSKALQITRTSSQLKPQSTFCLHFHHGVSSKSTNLVLTLGMDFGSRWMIVMVGKRTKLIPFSPYRRILWKLQRTLILWLNWTRTGRVAVTVCQRNSKYGNTSNPKQNGWSHKASPRKKWCRMCNRRKKWKKKKNIYFFKRRNSVFKLLLFISLQTWPTIQPGLSSSLLRAYRRRLLYNSLGGCSLRAKRFGTWLNAS